VREYVARAVSSGSVAPPTYLSSCACVLDTTTGYTPLHEAALHGGLRAGAIIAVLVDARANVLEVDSHGATALHIAARIGSVPAAAALIDAAVRIRYLSNLLLAVDDQSLRALDLAEDSENMEMMLFLGQHGAKRADRQSAPDECSSPIADAVLRGDLVALRTAFTSNTGASCFYPPATRKRPLLHLAVAACGLYRPQSGLAIIHFLLSHGANASQSDGSGDLPLSRAARFDRSDILKALLATMKNGTIDLQDSRGRTALHEAARVGARRAAMTLVMNGASLVVRDNAGLTPLEYAQQEGHQDVLSGIEMATRLPPSMLNAPGYMHSSEDDFPTSHPTGEQEEGNIAEIIGIVVGFFLGATAALVIGIAIRRYQLSAKGKSNVVALPTRQSQAKPAPPRELYKEAFDDLECLGNGSSDEDGATPTQSRGPVVIQVPGHQLSREIFPSSPNSDHFFPEKLPQVRNNQRQSVDPMSFPSSPKENSLTTLRNASVDVRCFRADAPEPPLIPQELAMERLAASSSPLPQADAFSYGRHRSPSQVGLCESFHDKNQSILRSSLSQAIASQRQIRGSTSSAIRRELSGDESKSRLRMF